MARSAINSWILGSGKGIPGRLITEHGTIQHQAGALTLSHVLVVKTLPGCWLGCDRAPYKV
jgi:hypothetical protein